VSCDENEIEVGDYHSHPKDIGAAPSEGDWQWQQSQQERYKNEEFNFNRPARCGPYSYIGGEVNGSVQVCRFYIDNNGERQTQWLRGRGSRR